VQQFEPAAGGQTLCFGKAAHVEVLQQRVVELRVLGFGEAAGGCGGLLPGVAQGFAEAERRDHGFERAAAHAGGHFARQQLGGRARNEEFDVFGVEQSTNEAFPAIDELDFVEEEGAAPAVRPVGVQVVVVVDQQIQVGGLQAGEAFVLEVK